MLSRSQRISKKLFPNSLSGRVFSTDFYSLRLVQGKEKGEVFRGSVVVSKKIAKTAVKRNLIRRRFYSLLREYGNKFPPGSLAVLYVRAPAMTAKYSELKSSFEKVAIV